MKTIGIICEYNPFHNGHLYHIERAKELTGADRVVIVMSGDYVQRGTPALLSKHSRAHMALLNGASAICELPVCYASGSAEFFAQGAISILEGLGCIDTLCFGSECGELSVLQHIAQLLLSESDTYSHMLQDALKNDGFHVLEEGLCGRTTVFEDEFRQNRKGSDMLPVLLESHNPINIVVLMLGTNDCKSYYHASAEVIGKGIEKLIEQIWNYSQSVKILLVSPILLGQEVWKNEFDPEFDTDSIETSKQLKAVYERIAKKQKIEFLAASDYAKPSKEDQEHMSVEGHRRLAEAVFEKIKNSELSA